MGLHVTALRCLAWQKISLDKKQISHFGSCILVCAKLGSDLSTDLLEALLLHLGILGEVEHAPQQGCRWSLCPCLYTEMHVVGAQDLIYNYAYMTYSYAVNLAYIRACRQPSFRLVPTFHWVFSVYLELSIHLRDHVHPCGRNKRQGLDPSHLVYKRVMTYS
jgi:hypothetical protein